MDSVAGGDRATWQSTTHDWAADVDRAHLDDIRSRAGELAPSGQLHLILEVLAHADEEAADLGRTGRVEVVLGDGVVSVVDDGRGTETRVDEAGVAVRKPIMSTKDVRFFDTDDGPTLPDGHPRRGISVVAALSSELVHENRRLEGGWTRTYRFGLPVSDLVPVDNAARPGTTVTFRPVSGAPVSGDVVRAAAAGFPHAAITVRG